MIGGGAVGSAAGMGGLPGLGGWTGCNHVHSRLGVLMVMGVVGWAVMECLLLDRRYILRILLLLLLCVTVMLWAL